MVYFELTAWKYTNWYVKQPEAVMCIIYDNPFTTETRWVSKENFRDVSQIQTKLNLW